MTRSLWYDRDGISLHPTAVEKLLTDMTYRRVDLTVIRQGSNPDERFRVSTIWSGLDQSFGDGPPLIFETMVFDGHQPVRCERYATLADAQLGHARMVAEVAAELVDATVEDVPDAPEIQANLDKVRVAQEEATRVHP
jgi:hypothetical protein